MCYRSFSVVSEIILWYNKSRCVNQRQKTMEGYTTDKENLHIFRGELALALAVIINSFGVVLMLHSGAGISAISSVPYAFSEVIPKVSLGTWTYIFTLFNIYSS